MKYRGILCAWTATLLLAAAGCSSEAVAPTAYTPFNLKGEPMSIALEYPEGWAADGGGKSNHWGRFNQGNAEIRFQTDLSGSLMADVAGGGKVWVDDEGKIHQPEPPIVKIHEGRRDKVAEEFSGYEEEEIPDTFRCGFGEGRKSEFIADGGLGGGKIHGFRATLLSRDRCFTIICTCPHADWRTLRPAFDHVLDSFKNGTNN